jgi:glycosyltransferase involved in cell wall biosynthesis
MSRTLITIPVYNAESVIGRSIESAVNQSLKSEVWVVDNLSTDNTRKVVEGYEKKYRNVRLFVNKRNFGRIGNWNICLDLFEKSNYDYFKLLCSGDELFPRCIEEAEKVFMIDKDIAAMAFPFEFKDLDGNVNIVQDYIGNHLFGKKKMKLINIEDGGLLGTGVCNVYRKSFIDGYRFNEMFITKNDFDFKIFSNGKGYYLDKVLARFNLDSRKTYHKAIDYITQTEFVFNRAYWLEKMKDSFTSEEYQRIREKIYIEFVVNNMEYYPMNSLLKMLKTVTYRLPIYFKRDAIRLAVRLKRKLYGKI